MTEPPRQGPPPNPPSEPPPPGTTEWLPQPPARRGHGRLVGAAAAVIVLAGGGVASYVAFSDSGSGGAASPREAVQQLVTDLDNSDYLGLLGDLAPGERRALADPVKAQIDQLKKLKVLRADTDPSHIGAVTIKTSGLTFSPTDVRINDHVTVVQVTGGKVTVDADAAKLPFSQAVLDALFPHGAGLPASVHRTIDIAAEIARDGGTPLRVATQQVDGSWYPSLFYTIADYAARAAGTGTPDPAARIPDRGGATPEQALRDLVDALGSGNFERAIELASPDELGVLHDYGSMLLRRHRGASTAPFTVTRLQFGRTDISGGVRLTLKSLAVTTKSGGEIALTVSGDCLEMAVQGESRKLCSDDVLHMVPAELTRHLTAAQRTALQHLLRGVLSVGVDMSPTAGRWYVDGVRTYFDLSGELFSHLQGDDALTLIRLLATLR
jgi:hypothetical protein